MSFRMTLPGVPSVVSNGLFVSQQTPPPVSERAARLIYAGLFAAVVVMVAVLGAITGQLAVPDEFATVLRYVGLAQLLVIGIVIYQIRARIPTLVEGDDPDGWWAANGRRVIALWLLAEGAATLGAVMWALTADSVLLLVVGAAVVLLFTLRPSVWTS